MTRIFLPGIPITDQWMKICDAIFFLKHFLYDDTNFDGETYGMNVCFHGNLFYVSGGVYLGEVCKK